MKSKIKLNIVCKKKAALCDYHGNCKNKAYREVYPTMLKGKEKSGWSYLCRKHYLQEEKKYKWKLSSSGVD